TTATDTLQLAPGVFVTWGRDDPRVGHVDRPFDLFELSADMVALLARFTRPLRADNAFQEHAVGPDARDAALAALTALRDAGDLQRQLWLYDTFGWQWEPVGPHDGFLAAGGAPGSTPAPAEVPLPISAKSSGTSKAEVLDLLTRTGYPVEQIHLVQGLVQTT